MNDMATDTTPATPVKITSRTASLPCKLTDKEELEKGARVAFLVGEIERLRDEMKNQRDQAKARIEEREAELKRVSLELVSKQVTRDVRVEERHVFRLQLFQEVRTDTNEVIHERPMTQRELQIEIPFGEDDSEAEDNGSSVDHNPDLDEDPPTSFPPLPTEKRGRRGGK